jgi:tetratricopeptide (TPR) repeat protein
MGDIYFFLQQFEMAKSYYNKALAYDPKIYSIHFNLGLINKVEERYVASFKHFQACFHAPEYTIPSMYFMYIMVRRSLMIELSKEQLLRQLTTWNTTKPTQEDMKELVA